MPTMPGNIAGPSTQPGASPVVSPGSSEGSIAAGIAKLKGIMPIFYQLLAVFPFGSKEHKAIISALSSLSSVAGKTDNSLDKSALEQLLQAKQAGGMKPPAPVGMTPSAPPSTPQGDQNG